MTDFSSYVLVNVDPSFVRVEDPDPEGKTVVSLIIDTPTYGFPAGSETRSA